MGTKQVAIDDTTYRLAPLNFVQYEECVFDDQGDLLRRIKNGAIVKYSLENAGSDANPPFDKIPAGHVLQMLNTVLEISGIAVARKEEATDQGEATAAENQG